MVPDAIEGRKFRRRSLGRGAEPQGNPEIFNTDQGSQFTDGDFTGLLGAHGIAISMDGRGRVL